MRAKRLWFESLQPRIQRTSGLIVLDQIKTLDKTRLVRRLGTLDGKTLGDTLAVLQDLFA